MGHCGGNLQRLESLANTGDGEYQCDRNSGCKLDEDEEEEDGHPIIRIEEQEWLEVIQNLLTMFL